MASAPRRVHLDFAVPVHRTPLAGAALCALGVAAAAAIGLDFQRELAERGRLESALAAVPVPHAHRRPVGVEAQRGAAEAAAVDRALAVPWTRLLAELEAASHDSTARVALLGVEPDPGKAVVRITAEVRDLGDALAYLERLQKSAVLRDPALDSHERRKDDPEHPLRVKLSAGWRL